MVNLFLLHSAVNLACSISVFWAGFFKPLSITVIVLAIVGLFGEIPAISWIQTYYIEGFSGVAFITLVCLIMFILKLFIFGVDEVGYVKKLKDAPKEQEYESSEEYLEKLLEYLNWTYENIKSLKVDIFLFKDWNYLVTIWFIIMNILFSTIDFFGFHFLTTTQDWIFGVVNLSVAFLFLIIGIGLLWWILWMDGKSESSFYFLKKSSPKKKIRGKNVWTIEVIAYISLIPLFKCGLVFSYWLCYKYLGYTERVSILIGIAVFLVLDVILIILLKILKRWIGKASPRLMYSPEEKKRVSKNFVELNDFNNF